MEYIIKAKNIPQNNIRGKLSFLPAYFYAIVDVNNRLPAEICRHF